MNAMTMYYDNIVSYKNDIISNFMNFNENLLNRNEKVEQFLKLVNLQNDVYLGNQKP